LLTPLTVNEYDIHDFQAISPRTNTSQRRLCMNDGEMVSKRQMLSIPKNYEDFEVYAIESRILDVILLVGFLRGAFAKMYTGFDWIIMGLN